MLSRRKHGRTRLWTSVALLLLLVLAVADPQLLNILNPFSNLTNGTWIVNFTAQGQADINFSLSGQLYCADNESQFSNYTCQDTGHFLTEVGYGNHTLDVTFGNASATAQAYYAEIDNDSIECEPCTDNNTCTDDSCVNGTCLYTNNSNSCDDGLFCTVNDTCSGGECLGLSLSCDDENESTDDSCNEDDDTCANVVIVLPSCLGINCTDNNTCTDDACINGSCIYINNSNSCDDGLFCTINDTCSNGVCSGLPRDCDDGNSSTNDSCNEEADECAHLPTETNRTRPEDGTPANAVGLVQYGAVLGRPVKWEKRLKIIADTDSLAVSLPDIARNVSARRIDGSGTATELNASVETKAETMAVAYAVEETAGNVTVEVSGGLRENDTLVVEYYTEAPRASEVSLSNNKKRVTVSGPDYVHYTNVKAFSDLPINVSDKVEILLYQVDNKSSSEADFDAIDSDGDGFYDRIEWTVPHLSNQTYDIIVITKALHLDENRSIIEDIYDKVKGRDNVWSGPIPEGHYVRATFRSLLDRTRDITVYARSNSTARIEVYHENDSILVAVIDGISSEGEYRTYLTDMIGAYDTFDLKITGAPADIDLIIDPIPHITFVPPTPLPNGTTVNINNITINVTVSENVSVCLLEWLNTENTSGGWTSHATTGPMNWISIASSSDGTKLAAAVEGSSGDNYIYTSTDSGITWTEQTASGSRGWISIASSSDGTKLAAVVNNGYIYTSADSGVTWTNNSLSSGSRGWYSIASSSNGTKLVAAVSYGYIYTSTDSGITWTEQTASGSRSWRSIASSSDGTKLAAVVYPGYIYTSTDSGVTWTNNSLSSGSRLWYSIASSSDGTKLAAVVYPGYIYTSADSGATWTNNSLSSGSRGWYSIASSSNGTKLAAVVTGGSGNRYIYTSTDSGATWTNNSLSSGSRSWASIASSSNGTKLAAAVIYGYIYTSPPIYQSYNMSVHNADNNTWANYTLTDLPDEVYYYYVVCNSTLGGQNQTALMSLTIDTTPPIPTITSIGGDNSAPYYTTDTTPQLLATTNEIADCFATNVSDRTYDQMVAAGDVDCTGDGGTSHTCNFTSPIGDGSTTFYVACKDALGNNNSAADNAQALAVIDTVAPIITITSIGGDGSAPYFTFDNTPTLLATTDANADCFASTDGDETYDQMSDDVNCLGDGTTSHTCQFTSVFSPGVVDFYVACKDTAGNKNNASNNAQANATINQSHTYIYGYAAHDVDIAILDSHIGLFVMAWCSDEDDSANYQVLYTNGTAYGPANKFDTAAGDSCRIAVDALNSTTFIISYMDWVSGSSDWDTVGYDINNNVIRTLQTIDPVMGSYVDVGVCAMNKTRYATAVMDGTEYDATYAVYNLATLILGQTDLDTGADPDVLDSNLVDCAAVSSTSWVFTYFDDNPDNIMFAMYDNAGTNTKAATIVSASATTGAVSVAGLQNGGFVIAYCDGTDSDLSFATYDSIGTGVSGEIDVDQDVGTCNGAGGTHVEVTALDTSDSRFAIIFDDGVADAAYIAVYNYTGAQKLAQTQLSTTNIADKAVAIAGFSKITGQRACAISGDPLIVAYNNQTGTNALWGTYYANGSAWSGACEVPPTITITSIGGDSSAPYYTADNTPQLLATTDENADCRATNISDQTYDEMSDDVDCTGDGTTSHTCDFTSPIGDGAITFYVACNDTDGNTNNAGNNAEASATIDATAPTITIIAPANNSNFNVSSVTFNVSISEQASWCGISISGSVNQTMTLNSSSTGANYTNSSIVDGSYSFVVSCNDTAGNFGYSSAYYFLIDTVYPNISFVTPPTPADGSTQSNTNIFVNVSASDVGRGDNNISTFIDFDNSLVGWWRMDDVNQTGYGAKVYDYTGRNNGTAVGQAVQTDAGKMGKAFSFDGAGDYVTISKSYGTTPIRSETISVWIFRKGVSMAGTYAGIVNIMGTGSNPQSGIITNVANTHMQCLGYFNTTGIGIGTGLISLPLNEWVLATCVFNYNGSVMNVSSYKNGVFNSSASNTVSQYELASTVIRFGLQKPDGNRYFNGTIDDVMIFNRSLSAEEISALYANQSSRYLTNNFTGLAEGNHTFKAYAQDTAGNVNATDLRSVTIDTTPPTLSWNWTHNTSSGYPQALNITVRTNEAYDICRLQINSTNFTMSEKNTTYAYYAYTPAVGNWTYKAYCNDTSGNWGSVNAAWYKITDVTAPVLTWNWTRNTTSTYPHALNITVRSNEAVSLCRLEISGSNSTMTLKNTTYAYYAYTPAVGNHTYKAYCNDTSNNWGHTNAAWYKITDVTAPTLTWNWTRNTTSTYPHALNITIRSNEAVSLCRLEISGSNSTMTLKNTTYAYYAYTPAVGNHTYKAYCNDTSNNWGHTNTVWYKIEPAEEVTHHHKCSEPWSCSEWSTCVNGRQVRDCTCGCDHDADCYGNNEESRSCETNNQTSGKPPSNQTTNNSQHGTLENQTNTSRGPPFMEAPSNLTKGETVNVTVTNPDGSPAAGQVKVTAPDGRIYYISLVNGVASIVLNQPGLWSLSYTDPNGKTVARTVNVTEPAKEIQPGGQPFKGLKATTEDNLWLWEAMGVIAIFAALSFFVIKRRS